METSILKSLNAQVVSSPVKFFFLSSLKSSKVSKVHQDSKFKVLLFRVSNRYVLEGDC